MKRRIAILGSTGSIGTQTLDVVRQHPDLFEVDMISAGSNAALLAQQAREFDVNNVVICNEARYDGLREALKDTDSKVWFGTDSLCSLVKGDGVDIVVGAMVGFSGLRPTLAALEAGKIVALANKETLVAAGSIVIKTMREHGAVILPVDSEHSAIFQCLLGAQGNKVEKIHLTASGGPFRTWERTRIAGATAADALKHPNWDMGAKVTIDSATMMNKGFELIEARWLFDIAPKDINIVVHPESIIHSMVEFTDGAVIAQMGCPDMREPIGFALSFPARITVGNRKLDFGTLGALHFEAPDTDRFPNLRLAYEAIERGGNAPCALNAANEVAVAAYLKGRIGFYDISNINAKCLYGLNFVADPTLDDIFATNAEAAAIANGCIN
ncbi:MAG: 1-deoxy-D-xylulose-5-phosphate reductoisomerase [Bacteroidales bacterium]|nr:1-deoxy-D-xylulose-5-phosphate reductoisomerase [Bacteroidales bacterium]MBO4566761.1 1-deoxy-D-xylulose-5-phosphate reductoisomerase [Bacteroidales bacterium]